MPELANRDKHEAEILTALVLLFQDADADGDLARLQTKMQKVLAEKLAAVFILAAVALSTAEDAEADVAVITAEAVAWSSGYATGIASDFAAGARTRLAAGSAPGVVFSENAARYIAITETTTAVTRGEQHTVEYIERGTGDTLEPIWRTSGAANVCGRCDALDGTPAEVWQDRAPGGPPLHGSCNCFLDYERIGAHA